MVCGFTRVEIVVLRSVFVGCAENAKTTMKPKRSRHSFSSEDSEESNETVESVSSSESESDDSSDRDKHKKKRKRARTSNSESDSEDQYKKSKKKNKHKKKKKHHKKKRHVDSEDESDSGAASVSDGEIVRKKRRHKHKSHKHRRNSESQSEENGHTVQAISAEREHRRLSGDRQPTHTYYQKEYKHAPRDHYDDRRAFELQQFYRGSSKEKLHENYQSQHYRDKEQRRPEQYEDRRRQQSGDYQKRDHGEVHFKKEYYHEEKPRVFQHHGSPHRDERRHDGAGGRDYHQPRRDPGPPHRDREYQERRYHEDQMKSRDMRRERIERPSRPPPPRVHPSPPRHGRDRDRDQNRRDRYEGRIKEERDDYRERRDREQKPFDRQRERHDRNDRDGRSERHESGDRRNNSGERRHQSRERRHDSRERRNDREASAKGRSNERSPKRVRKSRFENTESKDMSWGKSEVKQEKGGKVDPNEKEKPNFALSGKLTADANTVNGVVIKYTEPDDAKQPKRRWRFYPFKGDKALPILYIHRQSCFLMGREKKIVDIHLEHPSVSKQHAALQYRAVPFEREDGTLGRRVRPYIIDLESANGTFVNNKKIDQRRYVELRERDVVKFGFSQREYVLLHENSKDDHQDDDNRDNAEDIGVNIVTTAHMKREKRAKLEEIEDGE